MAAATTTPTVLSTTQYTCNNSSPQPSFIPMTITMISSFTFFLFLTLLILIFTLYTILNNKKEQNFFATHYSSPVKDSENATQLQKQEPGFRADPGRKLVLEILPSNSPKWDTLFGVVNEFDDGPVEKSDSGKGKKKRAKKMPGLDNEELVCFYPFTKTSSAIQRKIKQHYDQLVKAHGSKGLTFEQIGQFVNCLVEARNELQQKSKVIKRKFTITKALLFKADRSSYERLCQQIHKLELEQKRLEEDAFVYNWLQDQLKVSPAYKKMLEISASMEKKENSSCLLESENADFSDMSFEELLAQEKKDSFWQRNGKLRPCSD